MGLWSRAQDVLWTGRVIHDYGLVAGQQHPHYRETLSILLTERHGPRVFIKRSYRSGRWPLEFAGGVPFFEFQRTQVETLDLALRDALARIAADKGDVSVG